VTTGKLEAGFGLRPLGFGKCLPRVQSLEPRAR